MQGRKIFNLALLLIVVSSLCLMAFDFYAIYRSEIAATLLSKSTFVRLKLAEAAIFSLAGLAFLLRALFLFLADKGGFRIRTLAGALLIGLAATAGVEAGTTGLPRPWWLLFWELFFLGCLAALIAYNRRLRVRLRSDTVGHPKSGRTCVIGRATKLRTDKIE